MKKKASRKSAVRDEMRPEHDLSGGIRNRCAKQLRENGYTIRVYHRDGTVTEKRFPDERTVTLAPDVQEYFPTSQAVNRPLRTLTRNAIRLYGIRISTDNTYPPT